jgi:hypothetical protein
MMKQCEKNTDDRKWASAVAVALLHKRFASLKVVDLCLKLQMFIIFFYFLFPKRLNGSFLLLEPTSTNNFC